MSETLVVGASKDAYVIGQAGYRDYNTGNAATIQISSNQFGLMFFDVSAIPGRATCVSATLKLVSAIAAGTKTHDIYCILLGNANWVEGTKTISVEVGSVCWNWFAYNSVAWAGSVGLGMAGTDYNSVSIGSIAYPISAQFVAAYSSLTPAVVQTWFGAVNSNHGIKITESTTTTARGWCHRGYPTAAYRPELTVVYELPPFPLRPVQYLPHYRM